MLENTEKDTLNENIRNDNLSGNNNNNEINLPTSDTQIDNNVKLNDNDSFINGDDESPDPVTLEELEEKSNFALSLIEKRKYSELKETLEDLEPADIAQMLDEIPRDKIPLIFRVLPKELAAETFVEMDGDEEAVLIDAFSDAELENVINEMFLDDTVDLIEEMPANVVRRILRNITPEKRKLINEIMNYPDDSAGSIMTIEYVDLTEGMTVGDALKRIRRTGLKKETVYTCYVTDVNKKLKGLVTALDLMTAESEDVMISEIMDTGVMEKPYLKTKVFDIWKSRIVWLLLLMVSATFTGMIISSFETALAAQAILTAFIPMLMDSGGNSGSQASVTVIRGISTGEIEFSDIFRVMWKEFRVSIMCGLSLAFVTFIKIQLVDNLIMGSNITPIVALVVCITLGCTIIIAKFIGCTLPLIAHKIGFDPAVMASPFITTIVDAVSLLIYFNVARILLGI